MYNSKSKSNIFDIRERTFRFGVEIVNLIKVFPRDTAGFAIGNQLIRSGTSVGANVEEAQNSGTRKEFVHIMTISLKECRETEYWLKLIDTVKLIDKDLSSLLIEVNELIKILTSIIKKSKMNNSD